MMLLRPPHKYNQRILCLILLSILWHSALSQDPVFFDSLTSTEKKALRGFVFKVINDVHSYFQCYRECDDNTACSSVNFYPSNGRCELNNATHISHPNNMEDDEGATYFININAIKEINYCSESLGMEDGRIKDGDITASDWYASCGPVPCKPYKGRLNGDAAWVATTKSTTNEYLQVDLLKKTKLTSIATQGFQSQFGAMYTKEYKLKYSDNVASSFQDHGTTFIGNTDANSVVKNAISPPIVARYVRVYPLSWNTGIALRIELYGCVSN